MCFFPSAMMDGYKMLKFFGESQTMMFFAMGIMGVQVMQWMLVCATMQTLMCAEVSTSCYCMLDNALPQNARCRALATR